VATKEIVLGPLEIAPNVRQALLLVRADDRVVGAAEVGYQSVATAGDSGNPAVACSKCVTPRSPRIELSVGTTGAGCPTRDS
jgi:hypothetical protein